MDRRPFVVILSCLALLFAIQASAQEARPANVIDAQSPPAGFVAPKADGVRDLSMAKYARESFLAGEEGIVGLRVHVRQDGSVAETQIATSSGSSRLDQAAKDVVEDWRYQPATLNGSPVPAWIHVEIIWALQTLRFELKPEQARSLSTYYPRGLTAQGIATVRFLAMPDGTIAKAFIDHSSGVSRLDQAAIEMVTRGLRITGTLITNESVGGWFRLNVHFQTPGKPTPPIYAGCGPLNGPPNREATIRRCTDFLAGTSLTSYERADAYRIRGIAHAGGRELDQAIADFTAGIRTSPGIAELYVLRARAHLRKGNPDLALADLDSAIQVEPITHSTFLTRGALHLAQGRMEQALADYDTGVRLAEMPDRPAAYGNRCFFLGQIGRLFDALADCNTSLRLAPRNAVGLHSRGYVYFRLGQYQQSIQDYDVLLGMPGRSPPALFTRGLAKLRLGDANGEADVNAAKEMSPGIVEQMAQLGVTP
jgi:TonB family protein